MSKHVYKLGAKITTFSGFDYEGIFVPAGTYTIVTTLKDNRGNVTHLGIATEEPLAGWGDLNGKIPEEYGLWVDINAVNRHFTNDQIGEKMIIKNEFVFKRKNLKGKRCRIVGRLPHSKVTFVELDEFVDGCSADGLGKAGHCILVSSEYLEKVR